MEGRGCRSRGVRMEGRVGILRPRKVVWRALFSVLSPARQRGRRGPAPQRRRPADRGPRTCLATRGSAGRREAARCSAPATTATTRPAPRRAWTCASRTRPSGCRASAASSRSRPAAAPRRPPAHRRCRRRTSRPPDPGRAACARWKAEGSWWGEELAPSAFEMGVCRFDQLWGSAVGWSEAPKGREGSQCRWPGSMRGRGLLRGRALAADGAGSLSRLCRREKGRLGLEHCCITKLVYRIGLTFWTGHHWIDFLDRTRTRPAFSQKTLT